LTVVTSYTRRRAIGTFAALPFFACGAGRRRCAYCGMPLDSQSPWNAELVSADGRKVEFDSPRCALLAWRTGRIEAEDVLVQDYYDRMWRSGRDVLFVASSDVVGPMGADLVPIDRARSSQFAHEHSGTRPLSLSQITIELLRELR